MERYLDYFEPLEYTLTFNLNKKEKTFTNTTTIHGKTKSNTIKLHAVDFQIRSAHYSISSSDKSKIINQKSSNADYDYDGKTLTIKNLPNSEYVQLEIECEHKINENMQGIYLSTYNYNDKTESLVATQFESHYAREGFPCVDEPAAKAIFNITSLVSDDPNDIILTNTSINEPTPRMSTYLVAFVTGHFTSVVTGKTNSGVVISTYAPENQPKESLEFANDVAIKSIEYYEENFGVKYPLKKLDQVSLPDFEAGAMENWGLVTYRESMLLASEDATIDTKKSVALTVAHELSHQWFGDLVTMEWWDDLWLNESFASVMEYYATDAICPDFNIWEDFFTNDCLAALQRDAYSGVQSVHQDVHHPEEISTLFDGAIVYAKGAHLMFMLIRLLGWDNFKKGIKKYFEKYAYQNTIGDNLWDTLNEYTDFDIKSLMHTFIDRPGYPVITSNDNFKTFSQNLFSLDSEITPSDFKIPKVAEDMSGHYILNLSESDFDTRLAKFDTLSLEEKLRLLIDRSFVTRANLAPSSSLISLLLKFKSENNAAVWNIISLIISNLKIFFNPDSNEEKDFKHFVGDLIAPKLSEIGIKSLKTDTDNVINLRSILLSLAFYSEKSEIIDELANIYQENYEELDPETRIYILRAKILKEPELFETYLQTYQSISDPELKSELLFAITTIKDSKVLDKAIELLKKPNIVKLQDQFHFFLYLFRNHKVTEKVFNWMTENWDYLAETSGDKSIDNYPRYTANLIRDEKLFAAWQSFFLSKTNNPILTRVIEVGQNEISARLRLIESNQESVINAIKISPSK